MKVFVLLVLVLQCVAGRDYAEFSFDHKDAQENRLKASSNYLFAQKTTGAQHSQLNAKKRSSNVNTKFTDDIISVIKEHDVLNSLTNSMNDRYAHHRPGDSSVKDDVNNIKGQTENLDDKNEGTERSHKDDKENTKAFRLQEHDNVMRNVHGTNPPFLGDDGEEEEIAKTTQRETVDPQRSENTQNLFFFIKNRMNSVESVTTEETGESSASYSGVSSTPSRSRFIDGISTLSQARNDQMCRLGLYFGRELPMHDNIYKHVTCFFCNVFIANHRRKFNLTLNYGRCTFSHDNITDEPFDPSKPSSWAVVRSSLIDDLEANKLEACCSEATTCCDDINEVAGDGGDGLICPPTWDGWSCIRSPVEAGTVVPVRCPAHAYTGYPECYLYGEKTCHSNGTWYMKSPMEYTDYTGCSMEKFHSINYYWEITVHSISILVLVPALLVLVCHRALHELRFYMRVHFFSALIFRSVLQILELGLLKIPEVAGLSNVLEENGVGCKILVSFRKMALLSVWAWMMANSVFVYLSIARALRRPTNIRRYYIGAWGSAALLTAVWVLCRALLEDYQCWLGDQKDDPYKLHLITDIPLFISLLISLGLLAHMAYLLHSSMGGTRENFAEDKRRAFKATLFLVPMFGVQFLLTFWAPVKVDCTWLQVYIVIATALTGLQGLYASVAYCFRNPEVMRVLLYTWHGVVGSCCPGLLLDYGRDADTSMGPQTTMSNVHSDAYPTTDAFTQVELMPLNIKDGSRNNQPT